MRKNKVTNTELCGTPAFTNFKIDSLGQPFDVCTKKMAQLDHLFQYSLVYVEDFCARFLQISLVSLEGRHSKFLMKY